MKRTLIVNGEKYDLESSVITILSTEDTLVIKVADKSGVVKAKEDALLLDELIGLDQPVDSKEVVPQSEIPSVERPPFNFAKMGDQTTSGPVPDTAALQDQPSKNPILPRGAMPVKGMKRPLSEEEMRTFRGYRRDFGIVFKTPEELERFRYPIVRNKKGDPAIGIDIVSPEFSSLTEDAISKALLALTFEEQKVSSDMYDRDNFLALDVATQFLVKDIVDETAGTGTFQFTERVSVYENPDDSKRSHPPDGKTTK